MLQGRIRPRLRALHLTSYSAYLEYLEANPGETQTFIDSVTTNETYFYRTPRIWEYLEKTYLPRWISENPNDTFRAWSAAASSGEEARTLGAVLEDQRAKHPSFQYQITATDISAEILTTAEKGTYSGRSIEMFRNMRPELFAKMMVSDLNGQWIILPRIRS